MSHRPLIPALLFFIAGIMTGGIALPYDQPLILPLFLLIAITLTVSLLIPSKPRLYCHLFIFLPLGLLLILNTKGPSDLLQPAQERKKVIMEGTVLRPTRTTQDITRLVVKAELLFIDNGIKTINEKVSVTVYGSSTDFLPGQRIRFPATLRPFENFDNPGRYDYELAMEIEDLSCSASVPDGRYIVPMGEGSLGTFLGIIENARRPVRELLQGSLSERNKALYCALILGERQGIDYDLREPFNITGLGHVLAVSGLHIGLIAWLSFFLFRWLLSLSYSLTLKTDIRKVAAIITFVPVVAYSCLAGFQVSTQRAMIMIITYLFSIVIGREKEIWSTLALAAIIVLAIDPDALFSISFQLSFVAVTGILWLTPGIIKILPDPFSSLGRKNLFSRVYLYISGLIVITFSAVVFLMPFTVFYFHRISFVSIPANLLVVPILGIWILPLGLLSSLFLHIAPPVASLLVEVGSWGLDGMMKIIQFWSNFKWASSWMVTPNILEIILFYGLIFSVYFIKGRSWARIGLLLVLVIWFADISYWIYETRFNRDLRVTYLDVGQGNSALIQFPGRERMLIDGGGFQMGSLDTGRMVVAPFLFHSKILRIDYIVLSHPQSDHMNGLLFIASHFQPKEFWYNGDSVNTSEFIELMNIIASKKIKTLLPSDLSEERDFSGVKTELLHPPQEMGVTGTSYESRDLNNNSLVLKITYHGTSFLFPGDIEMETEEILASNEDLILDSDILLVPHHGSRNSSTTPFLRMVSPEICVISAGKGNPFGFPHEETLKRLRKTGCKIIRVDESGAARITVGTGRYEVKSFIE